MFTMTGNITIGFPKFFSNMQANVANLSNLPNWPWPMKESTNLIGGLLGHVCTCEMCDMKSSNGWTLMVLYSFNGWTQIVPLNVFKKIRLIRQISQPQKKKEFRKT